MGPDGRLALSGWCVFGGDEVVDGNGSVAVARDDAGALRLAGVLVCGGQAFDLELVSPAAGTPTSLEGAYRVELDPSGGATSTLAFVLDVAPSGIGSAAQIEEYDVGPIASYEDAEALVSPSGRVALYAGRRPSGPGETNAGIALRGRLAAEGERSAGGAFFVGAVPEIERSGAWHVAGFSPR
jgi:hypothetical protein